MCQILVCNYPISFCYSSYSIHGRLYSKHVMISVSHRLIQLYLSALHALLLVIYCSLILIESCITILFLWGETFLDTSCYSFSIVLTLKSRPLKIQRHMLVLAHMSCSIINFFCCKDVYSKISTCIDNTLLKYNCINNSSQFNDYIRLPIKKNDYIRVNFPQPRTSW